MKNNDIKLVGIKFNDTVQEQEPEQKRRKFVTGVKISEEGKKKLKRVFTIINRARHLSIRYIQENPDIELMPFKSLVMNSLVSEQLDHVTCSMVNQEMYHIHRLGAEGVKDIKAETKSVSFYEEKLVNNRFTINYRRDKIVIEDLDIYMELEERIPRLDPEKQFYLNICCDDLVKMSYVFINVTYFPPKGWK